MKEECKHKKLLIATKWFHMGTYGKEGIRIRCQECLEDIYSGDSIRFPESVSKIILNYLKCKGKN